MAQPSPQRRRPAGSGEIRRPGSRIRVRPVQCLHECFHRPIPRRLLGRRTIDRISSGPAGRRRQAGALVILNCPMPNPEDMDEFEALVADAIDALPEQFQKVLESVSVIVSDLGAEFHAYGHYFGDGVARDRFEDRIVIYRDTLERDFGHDHDLLARRVERTLRHELAHHLGWDERGVGGLGL
ncbi:MAG: hypothetical protein FVQ78_10110 [Solirubrobacterales bacterium]|nr:hypothetical protein [Solirubrobacterales bacterium]